MEKHRVYDFLAGLNAEYDQIRIQFLGKDPFPSLRQTYGYVQQKESRRSAMLNAAPIDRSGTVANSFSKPTKVEPVRISDQKSSAKDNLTCDYCRKPRHTKKSY